MVTRSVMSPVGFDEFAVRKDQNSAGKRVGFLRVF